MLNIRALYAALDSAREARGLTWREVARQTGVPGSTFSRMQDQSRPSADALVSLVQWLGLPAETFFVDKKAKPGGPDRIPALVSALIESDETLSKSARRGIIGIFNAAYQGIRSIDKAP